MQHAQIKSLIKFLGDENPRVVKALQQKLQTGTIEPDAIHDAYRALEGLEAIANHIRPSQPRRHDLLVKLVRDCREALRADMTETRVIGNTRVIRLQGRTGPVTVYANPTADKIARALQEFGELRMVLTQDQTVLVWPFSAATRADLAQQNAAIGAGLQFVIGADKRVMPASGQNLTSLQNNPAFTRLFAPTPEGFVLRAGMVESREPLMERTGEFRSWLGAKIKQHEHVHKGFCRMIEQNPVGLMERSQEFLRNYGALVFFRSIRDRTFGNDGKKKYTLASLRDYVSREIGRQQETSLEGRSSARILFASGQRGALHELRVYLTIWADKKAD